MSLALNHPICEIMRWISNLSYFYLLDTSLILCKVVKIDIKPKLYFEMAIILTTLIQPYVNIFGTWENMLKIAHGAINRVERTVVRALRRLGPPTSVRRTRANELWSKPIWMNSAIARRSTPPLWSDMSSHETKKENMCENIPCGLLFWLSDNSLALLLLNREK